MIENANNPDPKEVAKLTSPEKAPELTPQNLWVVMYLLLARIGTLEIPQDIFDQSPGPDKLPIERQWDGVNKVWRFFIKRKPSQRKPRLILPNRHVITN